MSKNARLITPPHPAKPGFSPMLVRRENPVYLVSIQKDGWKRVGNDGDEVLTLTAHLSDGATEVFTATMRYKAGEREGIMERAITGRATDADLRFVENIRNTRWRYETTGYRHVQTAITGYERQGRFFSPLADDQA